jgi:hypothetical protein
MDEEQKLCKRCGLPRPLSCFRMTVRGVWSAKCTDCEALPPLHPGDVTRRYRQRHPEQAKLNDRRGNLKRHGITPEQFDALLEKQNGCCAICGGKIEGGKKAGPFGVMCVDHDHSCCDKVGSCGKCIRGLVCTPCNVTVAWVEQYGQDGLDKIMEYLAKPPIIF